MARSAQAIDENTDVARFLEMLRSEREFFAGGLGETFVTRAPGRLDVMGGIADYSGSLVLQMPIAEAAFAAVQRLGNREIRIKSVAGGSSDLASGFEAEVDDMGVGYEEARKYFRRDKKKRWAAYVAGALVVLAIEKQAKFDSGAAVLIGSNVPSGKGVSSSAALEVAAMKAIAAAYSIELDGRELAILCQKVENLVVGAPCGIMDQMTASLGSAGRFLTLLCQPAEVLDPVEIPGDLQFWGIDSGVRHSVGEGDYGSVRTGAFMGYRMMVETAGLNSTQRGTGVVDVDDRRWGGYLANVSPDEFEGEFATKLPQKILGRRFLDEFGGITDTVTSVDPKREYAVFAPTRHPIHENARVNEFARILQTDEPDIERLGKLMYASHESYSACGLGTKETDLIVELVRDSPLLHGAKITGGGSGGTVAILGSRGADDEVERIATEYAKRSGRKPYIFSGTSMGAEEFGVMTV